MARRLKDPVAAQVLEALTPFYTLELVGAPRTKDNRVTFSVKVELTDASSKYKDSDNLRSRRDQI